MLNNDSVRFLCVGIFKFARHYFCRDLEEKGRKYIRHHFKQIFQESGEFKDLSCEELQSILHDDELNVRNEELVFGAIKTWVESKPEERKSALPALFKCIRFGLMSFKFFTNDILKWKFVEDDEVRIFLFNLIKFYKIIQIPRDQNLSTVDSR